MPVTIYDVATKAGVSKSTVSLVINNSNKVKTETRQKVYEAINDLGFIPNLTARGLTTKKTNVLGLLIMVEDREYQSYNFNVETEIFPYDVMAGMPGGLVGTNYGLLSERYMVSQGDLDLPNMLKSKRVDGIFIIGSSFDKRLIDLISSFDIPIVIIGRHYDSIDSISADISKGVYIAGEQLIITGHRRLCYINCPLFFCTNQERASGFTQVIDDYKNDISQTWLINAEHNSGLGGYNAIKSVFEAGNNPDGILAANDSIALGVMRYLYEKKISVPDDISIISYEDSILSGYATPALSSINIDKERIGRKACEIMINRLENPKSDYVNMTIPVKLVLRESIRERK